MFIEFVGGSVAVTLIEYDVYRKMLRFCLIPPTTTKYDLYIPSM